MTYEELVELNKIQKQRAYCVYKGNIMKFKSLGVTVDKDKKGNFYFVHPLFNEKYIVKNSSFLYELLTDITMLIYIRNISILKNTSLLSKYYMSSEICSIIYNTLDINKIKRFTSKKVYKKDCDLFCSKAALLNIWNIVYKDYDVCICVKDFDCMLLSTTNIIITDELEFGFESLTSLTDVYIDNFNVSKLTYITNWFSCCRNLENVVLHNFVTSNVRNMDMMFYGCFKLKNLDITSLKTSKCESFESMFRDCYTLVSLDLRNFCMKNCKNIMNMFYGCLNLEELNLTNWVFSKDVIYRDCIINCPHLRKVINKACFNMLDVRNSYHREVQCKLKEVSG